MPKALLGKLLTGKMVSKQAFSESIKLLWWFQQGLDIKVMFENQYLFIFEEIEEMDRILETELWHFAGFLLVLKRFQGYTMGEAGLLLFTHFWVCAFNLPLEGMIEEIGVLVGNGVGKCIRVESDVQGCCLCPCMRLKVLIDVSQPLRWVVLT